MKLKPDELWSMSVKDYYDMFEAHVEQQRLQDDIENQRVSWQTAHIMNSSGAYKKKLKPTDLYIPLAEQKEESTKPNKDVIKKFDSKEAKEEYLQNLLKGFGKVDGSQ